MAAVLVVALPQTLEPASQAWPGPPVAQAHWLLVPGLPSSSSPEPRTASRLTPAAAALEASMPRPVLASDQAEVCGLGVVRVDEDRPLAQQGIPDGVRSHALQRLGLAMASSRDERLRAAGKLLSVRLAVPPEALASAADNDAACRRAQGLGFEDTARFCTEGQARSQVALLAPASKATDELARMAAISDDPQVYAYAYEACHPSGLNFFSLDGNCRLITAERWARVAPQDAEPWLELAALAQARGDARAARDALGHAAQASAAGTHAGSLAALATGALPEGMPPLEQTAVSAEIARLALEPSADRWASVHAACTAEAVSDASQHGLCDALAHMLVERGRSSDAVTAGVQLGERLGWPADTTSAILQDQQATLDAALRYTAAPQALACDSLQRQRDFMVLAGRLGELDAGRELLRREGVDPASGRVQ